MTSRQGYDAYQLYLGVKLHFYSNYDFLRYNGKVKGDINTFLKRKDKYHFGRLAKKYGTELQNFYLANLSLKDTYAVDLLNDESADKIYKEWKKRNQKLTYLFESEMTSLLLKTDIKKLLQVKDGQHPKLLKDFLAKKVSLETMCILDSITQYTKDWNRLITETIVYPDIEKRIQKYKVFLNVNITKHKEKLLELCTS
jgi:hypothetical protein